LAEAFGPDRSKRGVVAPRQLCEAPTGDDRVFNLVITMIAAIQIATAIPYRSTMLRAAQSGLAATIEITNSMAR
jgi:hypothetical protein